MVELVAKRYGQALFELAIESGQLIEREQEIKTVLDALNHEPDLCLILSHPNISKDAKIEAIESIFSQNISKDLLGFLALAIKKGREDNIKDILNYVVAKLRANSGYVKVSVTSAVELTANDKAKLISKLEAMTGNKITLESTIDKALIGGLKIRINDRVIDSSIRTTLHKMSNDILIAKQ
jgi:F-type H+-transporting ATPase subunit delta